MASFEVVNKEIRLEKEVTKLDEFVLELTEAIAKYAKYVIISGYVSIFFGRARATEDVDMFIANISPENFRALYSELSGKGYEFTIDNADELYEEYLKSGVSINIWKKDFPLLRLEMKLALKPSQRLVVAERIAVKFGKHVLYFGSIESQIAYKRYIAKSDKDLKDARHLEIVFPAASKERIEHYRRIFEAEFK